MEPLRSYEPEPLVDRRQSRRVEVTCPATLETMTMRNAGKLWDISEAGARIQLTDPPHPGSTAVLRWAGHEAVCTVAWADGDMCGVSFRERVPADVVSETAALNRVVELPIACVGNIAQGQKRSAFHASLGLVTGGGEP